MNLRDRLRGTLTEDEMKHLRTSFDIIGDIAIIKVPEELEHRKEVIADAILDQHKNVNTVIRKTGQRSGEFRTAAYEVLRGDSTETIHKEHGCRFKLDPTKVYFSERLGHERQRVLEQTESGETVIDMFAGVGPISILLARKGDVKRVYAFEKNSAGAAYLQDNVTLNKVQDTVKAFEGDVREELQELDLTADRILMNLPGGSDEFIDLALEYIREGGIIHYYTFVEKDKLWNEAETEVKELFAEHGADAEIADHEICGHYNPAVERVCFDVRVQAKHI